MIRELSGAPTLTSPRRHKNSYQQRWESTFGKHHIARWSPQSVVELIKKEGKPMLLLMSIGIFASILDYGMEMGVLGLSHARSYVLSYALVQSSTPISFATWTSFMIITATLGMAVTKIIDPIAIGSGIPEMKTIISCDQRKEADDFLCARTLPSKAIGLTFAMGSGLSVGKEGPFVHTASIIAHQLMKHLPFFHRVYRNDVLRRHMYNAACAVGVASTFRASIGGVLFAIEVTSTVFMVTNYWRAFVASISGSIARQLVGALQESKATTLEPLFPTSFEEHSFSHWEFVSFAVLGVLMGIIGAVYVTFSSWFKRWWKTRFSAKYPFISSFVLLCITSTILYIPGPFSRLSPSEVILDLCSPTMLPADTWKSLASIYVVLPLAAFIRLIATIFSTSLPLPAGDFIPTFIAGTTLGRLYGEVLLLCFPGSGVIPGGYALVGGAAFVASATHTVSVAVIALEFTGQFDYVTPLILAVLLASGIGAAVSVSQYESVIISKGLIYLPLLRVNQLVGIKARDVMETELPIVPLDTHTRHIHGLLLHYGSMQSFPVVESFETMLFYGCIERETLESLVEQISSELQSPDLQKIDENDHTLHKIDEVRGDESQLTSCDQQPRRRRSQLPSLSQDNSAVCRENYKQSVSLVNTTIDSSVLQTDCDAPVETVHLLFEMIKCSRIWVTQRGKLMGLIHRKHMHARISEIRQQARQTSPCLV